jgi:hypothetical protein
VLLPIPDANARAGRAALRPGGLGRGAAARFHPSLRQARVPDHHRQLPACLALGLPAGPRPARPAADVRVRQGAELLRRPRRAWCSC